MREYRDWTPDSHLNYCPVGNLSWDVEALGEVNAGTDLDDSRKRKGCEHDGGEEYGEQHANRKWRILRERREDNRLVDNPPALRELYCLEPLHGAPVQVERHVLECPDQEVMPRGTTCLAHTSHQKEGTQLCMLV